LNYTSTFRIVNFAFAPFFTRLHGCFDSLLVHSTPTPSDCATGLALGFGAHLLLISLKDVFV
jgi:hypothetical protein